MKKKLLIEGMTCGHCAHHVTEALKGVEGVTFAKVDLAGKSAVVEMDRNIEDKAFIAAVDEAGYEVVKVESI